ncbi:MAG: hypothetical protein U0V72_01320 [Cytophagales bacterium]
MKTVKQTISKILISLGIITLSNTVNAQSNDWQVAVETDPSTFIFKGYAAHLRVKPSFSNKFLIGIGTYALDLPDFMVKMNPNNKNWNVRIQSAYALFGEYYFKNVNEKWFLGVQAGIQNYKNSHKEFSDANLKYTNLLLMPSIGYNWKPFKNGFYIKPWAGIGYTQLISGKTTVNSTKYDLSPIVPFVTVHIGYNFKIK